MAGGSGLFYSDKGVREATYVLMREGELQARTPVGTPASENLLEARRAMRQALKEATG